MNRHAQPPRRPCRSPVALLTVAFLVAVPQAASQDAPAAPEPRRPDLATFRVISERNIFNARRSRRSSPLDARRPTRVDSIALVGTLIDDHRQLAFFDGSSSDYRQVLKPGASIAGHRVASVACQRVNLENGTNTFELTVGMALRREEQGEWRLSERHDFTPGTAPAASASSPARSDPGSSSNTGNTGSASAAAEDSEVLKRLMQQREKELK